MDFRKIYYPDHLPVLAHKEEIQQAISNHQVTVVAGDTGCGKTTQIPKFCLELFPAERQLIGCTQPRRIAAATVSARVAEELGTSSSLVGYKIRFHDYTTPETRIKFMTDGVLLAETRSDPELRRYRVILLDEAHERSLNIDFLLGYLKQLLPRRPDLKLIITSATIDTAVFARHFGQAPVLTVSGRSYPVEVRYQPMPEDGDDSPENYVEHCAAAILGLHAGPPGDILAFLPTEKDIRQCCVLVAEQASNAVVLPMFGRLAGADQRRIFQQFSQRKIVIATNVAETSITVPGIRYVVDSGLARLSAYNARAKTTSLPVRPVSRASCDQRKGRCGRIGPGVCIRLYSEEEYLQRDAFTVPEIRRANLAEVILQMISLGLGNPETFPFVDPPHKNAIRDGYRLLFELGAITADRHLTSQGRFMASLPIDPCIARILLAAKALHCLREVTIIAAVLAIQDPRLRPADKEKEADAAHHAFAHPHSDFLTQLHIWQSFHQQQGEIRSWSKLKKFCASHFLSFQRMREWIDLHEQLVRILSQQQGFTDNTVEAGYAQIHQALASGLLRHIACKKMDKLYQGAGGKELMIFPGSHQFLRGGQWIVAASFLETSRLYALTVATIEVAWLEPLARHLCTCSWSSPRWQKKSGQVVADEQVSLFGLIIVPNRLINYGLKNPAAQVQARTIFIEEALLTGEITGKFPFLENNRALVQLWREREEQLRKSAYLLNEEAVRDFYDQRLPADVYDRSTLIRWLKNDNAAAQLFMSEDDILYQQPADNHEFLFPSTVTAGSLEIPVSYVFSPGADDDGVTFRMPLSSAQLVAPDYFDWLVPGLLPEKITALLRGLPKGLRKRLVPLNEAVGRALDALHPGQGSLQQALGNCLFKLYQVGIGRSDWPESLPQHLLARFTLTDVHGQELCSGRNLRQLITELTGNQRTNSVLPAALLDENTTVRRWRQQLFTTWDFNGLPKSVTLQTAAGQPCGLLFTALVASTDQTAVEVQFLDDQRQAATMTRHGLALLYRLQFPEAYRLLKKYCATAFSGPSALIFLGQKNRSKIALDSLLFRILRSLFPGDDIPSKDVFDRQVAAVKAAGFFARGQAICDAVLAALRTRRELLEKIGGSKKITHTGQIGRDQRQQFIDLVQEIIPDHFLEEDSPLPLERMRRQLQSLAIRLERFSYNPGKDDEKQRQLAPFTKFLGRLRQHHDDMSPEGKLLAEEFATMVDEYRIALFSPEMKTRQPVSAKRLTELQKRLAAHGAPG